MKKAFSLAEVLITLGIIGVVAAITMRALQVNVKAKMFQAQYSKGVSVVATGLKAMLADNELFNPEDLPIAGCRNDVGCISGEFKKFFLILDDSYGSLSGNALHPTYNDYTNSGVYNLEAKGVDYMFATTDGFVYGIKNLGDSFLIYLDVNGKTVPNAINYDFYILKFANNGNVYDVTKNYNVNCSAITDESECNHALCNWKANSCVAF